MRTFVGLSVRVPTGGRPDLFVLKDFFSTGACRGTGMGAGIAGETGGINGRRAVGDPSGLNV